MNSQLAPPELSRYAESTYLSALSQETLKSLLSYCPESGKFLWLKKPCKSLPAGVEAGGLTGEGYRAIRVLGTLYKAHRLAWLYVNGIWPEQVIDHINGDRQDNRIANLRSVTQQHNLHNQRAAHKLNSSGVLGVSKVGDCQYTARIRVSGKLRYLGTFKTAALAGECYLLAKSQLHAGFVE
jgi:hypothetical protein